MPRLDNSITIDAPVQDVFDITNDIARWPEYFDEYTDAKVLDSVRSGQFTALTFELSNASSTWRSWRLLDHANHFAIAERRDPLFPFAFMHLRWSYAPHGTGTEMTWVQDFELDSKLDKPLAEVIENMQKHTRQNQLNIKEYIEGLSSPSQVR